MAAERRDRGPTGRGLDLNDAFGNLGPFVTDASDIVDILGRQKEALKGLVRDTGTVFEALPSATRQLAGAIVGSDNTFDALASQDEALAETFQILPTFQRETRATLERLDEFQANAHPLVKDLIPVARDLSPTLRSVRELSPSLRNLFVDLALARAASRVKGLPALSDFLDGLSPVLDELDPFLANLNPVLRYLDFQRASVADFLQSPGVALSGQYSGVAGEPAPRHGLRQLGYTSAGGAVVCIRAASRTTAATATWRRARSTATPRRSNGIFPNFDCKNLDYATGAPPTHSPPTRRSCTPAESKDGVNAGDPPDVGFAPCFIQGDFPGVNGDDFGSGRNPTLFSDP